MSDTKAKKQYRVLTGMNYVDPKGAGEKRAEVGEIVDDIPVMSIWWLLEQGHIEPVDEPRGSEKAEKGEGGVSGRSR